MTIGEISQPPVSLYDSILDKLAENIKDAIYSAFYGIAKRYPGRKTGNPWWNENCRIARLKYKTLTTNTSDDGELKAARKSYRIVTKNAKEEYFRAKMENDSMGKEIFVMTNLHKSVGVYRSYPLKDPRYPERPLAVTHKEKMEVLLGNLHVNITEAGDILIEAPAVSSQNLSFPPITLEEIKDSIRQAGNITPGVDEITNAILKHAWPLIEALVHCLYLGCLTRLPSQILPSNRYYDDTEVPKA